MMDEGRMKNARWGGLTGWAWFTTHLRRGFGGMKQKRSPTGVGEVTYAATAVVEG